MVRAKRNITDATEAAGILPFSGSEGVAVGDFNQDGYDDFFVTVPFGQNRLIQKYGRRHF
jgi:hypothetical protein